MGDYGGWGLGRSPFWRTLEESCQGLGSVTLKKTLNTHQGLGDLENKQSTTSTHTEGFWVGDYLLGDVSGKSALFAHADLAP